MRTLVEALGHPEQRFRSVLIAGTNGKGSTAATLSAILQSAGYRVGLYTSPHLERVNERIRIDGLPIGDEDFARLYFRVDDCANRLVAAGRLSAHPSFFESLTAVAFEAFAEAQVDLAVLEVGMGGRLDATNVVEPLLSVITDISLDHMEWLGDTITLITREKAGILRRGGTLITLPQHPEANQAIGEVAMELDVRGINAAEYVPATTPSAATIQNAPQPRNLYPLQVLGQPIMVDSPLAGVHQQRNIALAIAAAVELRNSHGYTITPEHIEDGIRHTQWPGRLERSAFRAKRKSSSTSPTIPPEPGPSAPRSLPSPIASAARSPPPGARFSSSAACRTRPSTRWPKSSSPSSTASLSHPSRLRAPQTPRRCCVQPPIQARPRTAAHDGHEALATAWSEAGENGFVVVAGSVYLVGEIRPLLHQHRAVTAP